MHPQKPALVRCCAHNALRKPRGTWRYFGPQRIVSSVTYSSNLLWIYSTSRKFINLLCLMRTDTKSHLQLKDLYQEKMCTCTSIYYTAKELNVSNKHGRNKSLFWGSGRVINWPKLPLFESSLQGDAKIDGIWDTILKQSFLNWEHRPMVPLSLENCFEKNLRTLKWIWHINHK